MSLVSLLQKQVESRAQLVCQTRNRSLPVELGKSSYEIIEEGVVFIKQHYLLDSSHCDYMSPVAKVVWDQHSNLWQLYVTDDGEKWRPYPYLSQSNDLTAIMREIDKDPKALFW
ncbi:DUF3024 domain-containing protein [Vibrio sp. TRT 21S02]|uniref:DUF3024 domain-containing protein n=1 Tax=unclassified Vibrio TaxID=2614977 RepID=UPI00349FCAD6